MGNRFRVRTDHNSLRFFLEQKQLQERQQKWVSKLQAYDFDIEYVKGKHNVVVDALSMRLASLSLMSIAPDWKAHLLVEYSKDWITCKVLEGRVIDDRCRVMDEVIYYEDRIYLVVATSQLREMILQVAHDSPLAVHQGFNKIYRSIWEVLLEGR